MVFQTTSKMEDERYRIIGELLSEIFREMTDLSQLPSVYGKIIKNVDQEVIKSLFSKGVDQNQSLLMSAFAAQGMKTKKSKKR